MFMLSKQPIVVQLKPTSTMPPIASYTKTVHNTAYAGIDPRQPALSTSGKVVVITGASGGIGRATASSFAQSGPKALILLGRKADALARTAQDVTAANADTKVQTHAVDLLDAAALKETLAAVARDFGAIDILVHSAGHLPPIKPLLEVDASQFLQGFETTVTGTLSIAQAVLVTNAGKPVTFVNLTTAGVLFPPFRGMGTYVACKMAALKVLQALAGENPSMRLVNVHPGFLKTDMSANLESSGIKLPFAYDDSK